MKVLFIVQGEGRGHLTQAITMEQLLRRNGHTVVEVLVGKSGARRLPSFFINNINAPVERFDSPNFLPTPANKRSKITRSVVYNVLKTPTYVRSMKFLNRRINESGADLVVNFYEMLTGLTYFLFCPEVPQVSIGHQYLFLHKEFKFPKCDPGSLFSLRLFTRITSLGAKVRLALSLHAMADDDKEHIKVVPPLLRTDILSLHVTRGNYIHGYMVNAGFGQSIMAWHKKHPEVDLRFFWDKKGEAEVHKVDATLSFHQINDEAFMHSMAGCKAYATTAGFESVCEAMYLGKPVMMVPAHIEQDCNAYDAAAVGAGIVARDFDIDRLLAFTAQYHPNKEFRQWVDSSNYRILLQLERVAAGIYDYPMPMYEHLRWRNIKTFISRI